MLKKYIEIIGENKNPKDMEKLGDMLAELIYMTKESHPDLYEKYKIELYEMAYGKQISEEMAHKWVESMQPLGKYWSIGDTTKVMNELGYNHDNIDFYVVANMMKNDYNDLTEEDDNLALKMAHDWLNDDDAKDCKLYQYWKYVIKRD